LAMEIWNRNNIHG